MTRVQVLNDLRIKHVRGTLRHDVKRKQRKSESASYVISKLEEVAKIVKSDVKKRESMANQQVETHMASKT